MSRDPYHDFASDLKSSLASARSLSQSYRQLLSQSQTLSSSGSTHSSDIDSAHDRLSDAIEGLRQDVEDVKQSVLVVERSGPERFGVTPEELKSRKAFVAECEAEVKVRRCCFIHTLLRTGRLTSFAFELRPGCWVCRH